MQRQERGEQGQGERDERDDRGAHIGQEEEEHDDHEQSALHQRLLHVADGALDEAALAEDVGGHADVGGEVLLQVLERGFQFVGQFQCAGVRLFGDGQQDGGLALLRGRAQSGQLGAYAHLGDVLQADGGAASRPGTHHGAAHFIGIRRREQAADDVLVAILIEHAAIGIDVHAPRGGQDFAEADAVVAHPLRVQLYLIFLDVSAQHGHLCHAAGREQARTDSPVGQGAEVNHRGGVGGQAHDEHFAQDGRLRAQRGASHVGREGLTDDGELLAHNLAGQVDVHVPVELHPYDGESVGAGRAHAPHARGSVDSCLDGEGDQLLHFLGGHAVGFGHDDHCGSRQVGEYVHLRMQGGVGAAHQQEHGGHEDQHAVVEGKVYDSVQHNK